MNTLVAKNIIDRLRVISLLFVILAVLTGCSKRSNGEIIVIIEDPGTITDTSSTITPEADLTDTLTPQVATDHTPAAMPSASETRNLTGAVVLLKNDLQSGNAKFFVRHCDAILQTVESESGKAQGERKRSLNLFYLELSSLKRAIVSYEDDEIPPLQREELILQLDELLELARRIEE